LITAFVLSYLSNHLLLTYFIIRIQTLRHALRNNYVLLWLTFAEDFDREICCNQTKFVNLPSEMFTEVSVALRVTALLALCMVQMQDRLPLAVDKYVDSVFLLGQVF